MSLMFHYWFIFDECNAEKAPIQTADQLISNCNLEKYNSPEFLEYLRRFIPLPDEPKYSPILALKFYVDYEMWLPPGFNWKYYTSRYPDLSDFNEFNAIEHWINHGKTEGRLVVPDIYTKVISQDPKFDWKFYTTHYPDLSHFNEIQAMEHWIVYGKTEGRLCAPIEQS